MKDLIVEKVMSLAQRRKRAQELRRIEPKLVRQRSIKRKRLADESTIYSRAQKLARKMFRIKFAGQQGAHYQSLSPTQKMEVDRLIDQRGQAIKKLAVRLIPIVRMAEYKRFQALKGKHGEPTVAHLQSVPSIKEDVEILAFAEVILEDDMSKFNKLMAVGLVDKDKYLQYKKAMSDIRRNAKIAAYREMILNVLDELVDVVTKDPAIYQRVKMAVEKND